MVYYQLTIINSNSLSAHTPMPPKNKRQSQSSRSYSHSTEVVAIEQHLSREEQTNDVPQIMKKIENAYKESKETLNSSLLHMIARLCGLSEHIPALTQQASFQSVIDFLEDVAENKVVGSKLIQRAPILANPKEKFYSQFVRRLKSFFNKLLSDDFVFMKDIKQTKFLERTSVLLGILTKSKSRETRLAAVEVMRLLIEQELNQYNFFIDTKQSRKAIEFIHDVQKYLENHLKHRLRDVDVKIREHAHTTIEKCLTQMEKDLNQKILHEIFNYQMKENNPKIIERTLQTLSFLIRNLKDAKRFMIPFVSENHEDFLRFASVPNKNGWLSLKILIEANKLCKEKQFLNPEHISYIFEFYSIDNYSLGLNMAIKAFYSSMFSEEEIYDNRNLLMIEIVNLVNNFSQRAIKQTIISHFFNYDEIKCDKIFYMDGLFQIIMSGEYHYNDEQVEMSDKQMVGWLQVMIQFVKFIKKNINKYETFQGQKYQTALNYWKNLSEEYNSLLLGNIREIYHEKIEGKDTVLTKYYLEMIGQLFLPINGAYQKYVQFLIEKIVILFQTETEQLILKGIVDIFFNLQGYNIKILTNHLMNPSRIPPEVVVLKKLAVLNNFYVEEFVTEDFLEEVIRQFNRTNHTNTKMEFIIGIFVIHQWHIKETISHLEQNRIHEYRAIQHLVISFLFKTINSRQNEKVKFSCINILFQLMTIICRDEISDSSIYLDLSEEDFLSIFQYLDREYGLPRTNASLEEDRDLEMTRHISSLESSTMNIEKTVKLLFNIFDNCTKISTFPFCVEFIIASLLREEENSDHDQTLPRHNTTLDTTIAHSTISFYGREKIATKYFQQLIEKEIEVANASKFIFWKIFALILQHNMPLQCKQKVISKLTSIYLKKKLTVAEQKSSLNKALLYIVSEFDRIRQTGLYKDLPLIQLALKKFAKKINKQALQRVFVFFKSKYENVSDQSEESIKNITNMIVFLQKLSKETRNVSREEENDSDSDEDKENHEHHPQRMEIEEPALRPPRHGYETRSANKRMERSLA